MCVHSDQQVKLRHSPPPNTTHNHHNQKPNISFTTKYQSSGSEWMAMAEKPTESNTPRSPNSNRSQTQDYAVPFTSHTRGHGSFSANAIRSPTSPAVGGGPGIISRMILSSPETATTHQNESALQTPPPEKPAIHRLNASGSVQALVVDDDVLFAGLQGGEIVAWSLDTFEQLARIPAHQQSVLGLSLSEDKSLLFSCGVDSVVNVWSTQSLKRLFSFESYFEVGDIFCVVYSARINTLFCGSQNSSIQWYELETQPNIVPDINTNGARKHRFFDSLGPGGVPSPIPKSDSAYGTHSHSGKTVTIPQSNYTQYAHKSYIYSMLLAKGLNPLEPEEEILITAGGGGTIKLWSLKQIKTGRPKLLEKFKNRGSSIFSLAYKAPFLYAGLSDGIAHVYNLASRQLVQRISMGCGDILQIQIADGNAMCATSEGWVKTSSDRFAELDRWVAHDGKILAITTLITDKRRQLITGGSDNSVAMWDLSTQGRATTTNGAGSNDELVNALRTFVSFRTVAGDLKCVSDCHQAATFLRKQFNSFGAATSFITPEEGINPILLAKFQASAQSDSTKTVLFYGHYDVIDAEASNGWHADPFVLHPLNGYLYGRGVTDNKGPILAALYAVADLSQHEALSCNVIFLLEGDEEAGSRGFRSAVQQNRQQIGDVDFIILSNSYWLDDHIPCLTFGMRGVIHASVTVVSSRPDLHSGVDGKSLQHEPLKDLTVLLGALIGDTGTDIKIPHFYDAIDELNPNELKVYSRIVSCLGAGHPEIKDEQGFMQSLMQKWRDPNLTIHQIQVPEAKTAVTISRAAKATLSVRIVPSQSADKIAGHLERFLNAQFAKLATTNTLTVRITSKADPWLGKVSSEIYSTLKQAVTEVWSSDDSTSQRSFPPATTSGTVPNKRSKHRRGSSLTTSGTYTATNTPIEPLFIREGGSIPAISFLEKEFVAPAAMFPMGQASDNAHLDNERIRLENLYKGRDVLKKVFARL